MVRSLIGFVIGASVSYGLVKYNVPTRVNSQLVNGYNKIKNYFKKSVAPAPAPKQAAA